MMRSPLKIPATAAIALMSACTLSAPEQTLNFAGAMAQDSALIQEVNGTPTVQPYSLPRTGSATYDGTMYLVVDPGEADAYAMIGQMSVTTNFANDTINGEVTDVVDQYDTQYDGTLDIYNGEIDRAADPVFEPTFTADVGGTLYDPNAVYHDINGTMTGDFRGDGAQYIDGYVEGALIDPYDISVIQGDFVAVDR